MKRFHATYRDAKKVRDAMRKKGRENVNVYDLKKIYPRRVKTRYFVGNHFDYLNV